MAETAKILAPDKTVLIPDARAGCSLADSITADQLRAWKAEHPGAVVVSYVNTTAEVKAETDICCTSSNAVEVVESIPADREVLFLPDQFLGAHVRRVTGRENMHVWAGECHVHAGINGAELAAQAAAHRTPSCSSTPSAAARPPRSTWPASGAVPAERVKILSTGGMLDAARDDQARSVLVATEIGMLHQLRRAAPEIDFRAVNDAGVLPLHEDDHPGEAAARACARAATRSHVDPRDRRRARRGACERMIAIGRARRWRNDRAGAGRRSADLVVVGSGVAGLTAALDAAAAGLRVAASSPRARPTAAAPAGRRAASRSSVGERRRRRLGRRARRGHPGRRGRARATPAAVARSSTDGPAAVAGSRARGAVFDPAADGDLAPHP